MSNYRRLVVPTTRFFFTVRLHDQNSDILIRHIEILRDAVRLTRQCHPFVIDAAVILPSRIHMIWSMPPGDDDYGRRWQMIKTSFARHLPYSDQSPTAPHLWQRRYWEQKITDSENYQIYENAIAQAPVEEGLARKPGLYPYSSFFKPRRARQDAASARSLQKSVRSGT